MREIKFRFYKPSTGFMKTDSKTFVASDLIEEEDWKIMQYTGLKDKNGKEIYENDIVRHKNPDKFGKVVFGEYSNQIGIHYGWFIDRIIKIGQHKIEPIISFGVSEVIGNIYENPELLPGGKDNEPSN